MDVLARHSTAVVGRTGAGAPTMVLLHGFGCDQGVWRHVAPAFTGTHRVVLPDLAGAGGADPRAYDRVRHARLDGYAEDVVQLLEALGGPPVVLVGHSVSASIAVLVAAERPDLVERLVLVCPNPRFVDAPGYRGGLSPEDVEELLETLDSNYLGWSRAVAPLLVGAPDRPELGQELADSFCRGDPEIARRFARTTFLSDNRADLGRVRTPALVVQCREDVLAPLEVGDYVHEHLAGSRLEVLDATGHCPNLSAPAELVRAVRGYLATTGPA